ncbi:MAG: carboxymuconolactone decarboxylase family protein [Phycisphaerales bacterium]|nr:carboxymuconolactone decarboxylase family protein [Phycisphaerales bacterium]
MQQRIHYMKIAPDAFKAMLGVESYVRDSGLEHSLLELIKTRVSQMNGCAFCLDMHTKDARAAGETEQRLYLLSAWRESPFYTERERAALLWAENVTQLPVGGIPDEIFDQVSRSFDEKALVDLTMAIIAINGWNRLSISFRTEVGTYQPPKAHAK